MGTQLRDPINSGLTIRRSLSPRARDFGRLNQKEHRSSSSPEERRTTGAREQGSKGAREQGSKEERKKRRE